MVGSPHPFAGLGLGCSNPPTPLTAVINGPRTQLLVTFSRPLLTQPVLDDANWAVRFGDVTRDVVVASALGTQVTLSLSAGGADVDIDRVNYAPPPFDVLALDTLECVAAFTDFPVTT